MCDNNQHKTFVTNGYEYCDELSDNIFVCKMLEYINNLIYKYSDCLQELEIMDNK